MKLFIPQSIFAGIAIYNLSDDILNNVESRPAALLAKDLYEGNCDVALIPVFDLLKHEDLFISRKAGIAFDGALCNAFLYFRKNSLNIEELFVAGDVSANEIFLSKILFEEFYDTNVNITLETKEPKLEEHNYLIVGNSNFQNDLFTNGISMAEQIAEFLDYPYVSYVFASKSKETLEELNKQFENIDEKTEDNLNNILDNLKLSDKAVDFIRSNFNEVYFELTQNEIDGLQEMLKIPYYKGITENITELNLV